MSKLIRTSTIAMSLDYLLKGQLAFLKQQYEVLAVSGTDKHLEAVAAREQVSIHSIPMQRSISPLKDLKSLWQLYWLFKKEKPLIVHSITPKAGLLTMLAGYFAKVPVRIHTFTGLIFPTKKGFLQQLLIGMDRLLCSCATHIYPEGQGVKKDLISYRITSKPLRVLANGNVNGIDTHFFSKEMLPLQEQESLQHELGITDNDFVFVFVGRLVADKGINELVSAFKKLKNEDSKGENHESKGEHQNENLLYEAVNSKFKIQNSKLLLVGPLESELDPLEQETLKEIASNTHIISVGFQKDVRPYLGIGDCLVFPSYREGFPNVVLQAGAMGLPSIVTNINGSNEIIIDGQNGVIVPVKSTNALQEEMMKMMCDLVFYNELQRNARALIVSRYKQEVVWEAILAEYKRLEKNV
ncbi:Glycosyltransferase involved in cell wall bisynthesis [Flavobacterium omnivorum]|uniref:Glycosyltransferase involved in cell wall bisynthesis n=1 Tax=Flavobacterium omnivorum TaxID=178355 RepID=A0A1G8DU24_9FLAO|nr:glycosyltransferase family 4 protein [Flavobacterium omnivorum]SDH61115.1 Glycosyltransferase involved in cell wall bisynthesis [Flavobacterium omnivorum]